jgi:GNAT superfamily N-acetyltransferase
MSVEVRPARAGDGAALYHHWHALREHNAVQDARIVPAPISESEFVDGLAVALGRSGSITVVADDDGRLVGFASATVGANLPDRLPERLVNIGYLFVSPDYRRQGIARRLFEALRQWASTQPGVVHMEMPVLEGDTAAEAFWTSLGFQPFIRRLWAPLHGVVP